ncbi:MAG: aminotransferase class I/II-fold pyridoxal phosphate-dependent enzyme [Ignavibacteria bacterium]|nr:aminotransferase class I/II-fold pyridoxal phosphate-dependent enzyme [Ignavibacteria bacterium]
MNDRKRTPVRDYSIETRLIYGKANDLHWDYSHHLVPPISASATFRLDSSRRGAQGFHDFAHQHDAPESLPTAPIYIYDRLGEPNKDMLEETLAAAEQGDSAVTFASGMAAISAVLGILVQQGDEVLAHTTLYGCTYSLLTNWFPRLGVRVTFVDFSDLEAVRSMITNRTRVMYAETPVNPTLRLVDLEGLARLAAAANALRPVTSRIVTVVDSTFATPFCQRPLTHGIDFVVHSLTKGIGGFGTDIGGAVIGPAWSRDPLLLYRKDFGGVLSAKAAWPVLVQGLPSLAVRMRAMQATAGVVARYLSTVQDVERVSYPGLEDFEQADLARKQMVDYDGVFAPGALIYFSMCGDSPAESRHRAERFIDHIANEAYCITLAVSLGNIRTLIEHPGSMTHAAIPAQEQLEKGVDPGGIRLAIGLEKSEDIIGDLERSFESVLEGSINAL